ncbi:MAG: hypothetical protein AB1726_18395 [Planctomycetota bacterium]
MAKSEGGGKASRPLLLVGSGARSREIGAVLGTLAAVRAATGRAVEPLRPHDLADLEELLARGPGDGTLILEVGRVPGEDIGFVRRFLERHSSWRLVVVGDDPRHAVARGLLALPRAQWLPWPPDLDVLGALLPGPGAGDGHSAPRGPAPEPDDRTAAAPGAAAVSVGALFEELLADAAVAGEGTARHLFRCEEPVHLAWEKGLLTRIFRGLYALARRCAGPDGAIETEVEHAAGAQTAGAVGVRIDFPVGPLTDADLPALLEEEFEGDPDLAEDVAAARAAAEALRRRGGTLGLAPRSPGRLRLSILLPARPGTGPEAGTAALPARGSPEDPFA